jgi:uncharacterized protein (DUF1501 family)
MRTSRRRFLEIVGVGAGVVALDSLALPMRALAGEGDPGNLLLFVYFSGGWDQLLCWDPRPHTDPKYQVNERYNGPGTTGIFPGYDMVVDPGVEAVLAVEATKSGVQKSGNLTFGPAIPQALLGHSQDFCLVRGMAMDTLTHEVGRRFFLTGKFPRGLAASGSSMPTMVASLSGNYSLLPHLSVSAEAYNEGQPAFASPIRVNSSSDVLNVLKPLGTPIAADSDEALLAYEDASDTCEGHELNGSGLVSLFQDSRKQARSMVSGTASTLFSYSISKPVEPLFSTLGIGTSLDLTGPKGKAAIAALALENGLSQAVGLQLASNLDDHFDWDTEHATTLRTSFEALGNLITYLKNADYKGTGGGKVWDRTTLVVFSEFARTPTVNSRNGRDHHLTSSCLVSGPGIVGNQVLGASSEQNMDAVPMNLTTGAPDPENGHRVRPPDVHATVLTSMGLTYDHISNQTPELITKMLKNPV